MMLAHSPTSAVSTSGHLSITSPHPPHSNRLNPSLFAHRRHRFAARGNPNRLRNPLSVANSDSSATKSVPPPPLASDGGGVNGVDIVGDENVPLEGVIQFDKPKSSNFSKWSRIALLAGGDVLALLLFSAIGRFSHGFPVFDAETLRTADPFIAGWFLSAYFLGGYGEDGRGINGYSNAVIAAAKSWALGIPVGVGIRSLTNGHLPPANFILVTMGSTAVLLIGWRALLYNILPDDNRSKKDDTYRRGNPFELFELLTSLIRRW